MGKCNEIISKILMMMMMMMMVKISLMAAIFHADFEEKSALTTSGCPSKQLPCVLWSLMDINIIDTIKITRIIS